jgi:hypothetical protein
MRGYTKDTYVGVLPTEQHCLVESAHILRDGDDIGELGERLCIVFVVACRAVVERLQIRSDARNGAQQQNRIKIDVL